MHKSILEFPDTQTKKSGKKVAFGPSQNQSSGIYKVDKIIKRMEEKLKIQNAIEQAHKMNAHFGLRDPHIVQTAAHEGYLQAMRIFDETVSQNLSGLIYRCVYNAMQTAARDFSRYYSRYQDVYRPDGEGGYYFDESCMTNTHQSPEYTMTQTETLERLADARKTLTDRERQVINLVFGFTDKPLTQSQTAKVLGISKRRVSQLYNSSLNKLSNYLHDNEK